MLSADLQRRIAAGEREAFQLLYDEYGRDIYLRAAAELDDAGQAQRVVKQSFLSLHAAIRAADGPVDAYAVLDRAAREAIAAMGCKHAPAPEPPAAQPAEEQPAAPVDRAEPEADADEDDLDSYAAPAEAELPARQPRKRKRNAQQDETDALLERVRARTPVIDGGRPEEPEEPAPKRSALGNAILSVFLVLFLIVFLWILTGILMDFELLPRVDLGFRWFNENVFQLFSL